MLNQLVEKTVALISPLLVIASVRLVPKAISVSLPARTETTNVAAANVGDKFNVPVEAFANGDPWTCAVKQGKTCVTWYHQTTKEFYKCTAKASDKYALCTVVPKPWS
jgi:hypothetical protein